MTDSTADTDYSREQTSLHETAHQNPVEVLVSALLRLHQQQPACRRLLLGVSGGLDSMVLLHACHQLHAQQRLPFAGLRVVHVNHGISAHADAWQAHCLAVCRALDVDCVAHRVTVQRAPGQSPEAVARDARYQVFAQELAADEALLLAHHQDDQLETVLLRLLRAAGPRGLAGMPESRALGAGVLWRPLLAATRAQLAGWARANALQWHDDDSNGDDSLSRNYLRHRLMPTLAEHWPGWRQSVARTAALGADADLILSELAGQLLLTLSPPDSNRLSCAGVRNLSAARQRLVIRHWLLRETEQVPGWRLVQRVQDELLSARDDAQPQINWQHWQLRRFRDELYLIEALDDVPAQPDEGYAWRPQGDGRYVARVLPGNGSLRLYQPVGAQKHQVMRLPAGECVIRYRRGGEVCALPGRPQRPLKKILQESALPPWVRERTPLLYIDHKLAWIVGVGVCDGFQAVDEGAGWAVSWQTPSRQDHI
ncbi:MAG: tRNA lysidine(34) synthetase TilS [Pseudohongiella sp.]|uniref:tRNA lysidine(34) synthetase TilS n=1 Tax=Pseudohongiella sp. TaxID=1979412 RepID=UPI0034A0AE69